MAKRFVVKAYVDEAGEIESAYALDNTLLQVDLLERPFPDYINERVALLRLCDVNREEKGEAIGRKFSHDLISVYLSYDEYAEIKYNRSAK